MLRNSGRQYKPCNVAFTKQRFVCSPRLLMSINGPSFDDCAGVADFTEDCNSGDPPFRPTLSKIKCLMESCHGNLLAKIKENVKFNQKMDPKHALLTKFVNIFDQEAPDLIYNFLL